LAGGIIGGLLGTIVSEDKEEGAFIGAMLGAGLAAIAQASKNAEKLGIPIVRIEDDNLVRVYPDGRKEFIKEIKQSKNKYQRPFKLK
jgi:hypothetical protein